MFLLLLWITRAEICPKYQCTEMSNELCAEFVSEGLVYLNSNACPSNSTCLVTSLVNLKSSAVGSVSKCTNLQTPFVEPNFKTSCLKYQKNKDLVEGSHPKLCITNADCQLKDKTFSQCICSLNGKAYCQPDFSSSVFNFYWKECADNDNMIEGDDFFRYTELLKAFYIYTINPVSCSPEHFAELEEIDNLREDLGDTIDPNTTDIATFQSLNEDDDDDDSAMMVGVVLYMTLG
mmetsp:Transcript_20566/g.38409  ORF Transcript_20566/g.38409 Transcript_20566/m.38409 type:complete len:234 (-) Transcript_20566:337-1038(-)